MNNPSERDQIYAQAIPSVPSFTFDERVAAVFPDMIKRSVPGYTTIIAMTGVIANHYAQANTHCYDLGCSLGASTLSIRHHVKKPGCKIIAIDSAEAMINRCRQHLEMDSADLPVELVHGDICSTPISNASFAVMNFTLQFIPSESRENMLRTIYLGLNPGGALLLSEKIHFENHEQQDFLNDLHLDFKRAQGYSDLEISQKRTALENVLVTETTELHQQRLRSIGFTHVVPWFQCLNFLSLIAVK